MARRRRGAGVLDLPPGVHPVKRGARTYYYWQPGRGTDREKPAVALGKDPRDPDFWAKLRAAQGQPPDNPFPKGSWAALVRDYHGSPEWNALSQNTREDYEIYLKRIVAKWGRLQVAQTTVPGIYALRDSYASTPVAANHMIAILRGVIKWGIGRGYGTTNPAREIIPIPINDVDGARPWPEWAWHIVMTEAPERLRRAAFLGRAIGQRRSDLVRIGRANRRDDGFEFKIKKLRGKSHFIPLTQSELAEIDSWPSSDIGPYIVSPKGTATTGDLLANALAEFCGSHARLRDAPVLLHGLRAMAVCDRRLDGLKHQEIAAQLCMSMAMVMRYSRHIDNEALARAGNERREQRAHGIGKRPLENGRGDTA